MNALSSLSLSSDVVSKSAHTLEARRTASIAGEIPGSWLLDSPGLARVLDMAGRLARAPGAPVLIEGERGTGVLELARLIHDADPVARAGKLRVMAAQLVGPSEMRGGGARRYTLHRGRREPSTSGASLGRRAIDQPNGIAATPANHRRFSAQRQRPAAPGRAQAGAYIRAGCRPARLASTPGADRRHLEVGAAVPGALCRTEG